jgi:hypothetical protein
MLESACKMILLSLAMLTQGPVPTSGISSSEACAQQPMPRAIDIDTVAVASHKFEFAATPALGGGGGAWVIRIWHRGTVETQIEILKLRRQLDCNRYDVERSWRSTVTQDEYAAVASKVMKFGVPDRSAFIPPYELTGLTLDGVSIDFRLQNSQWRVDRSLNLGDGPNAESLSKVFHDLAAKYIPASELPSADWRASVNTK